MTLWCSVRVLRDISIQLAKITTIDDIQPLPSTCILATADPGKLITNDVMRVCITEQTIVECNLFVLFNKIKTISKLNRQTVVLVSFDYTKPVFPF